MLHLQVADTNSTKNKRKHVQLRRMIHSIAKHEQIEILLQKILKHQLIQIYIDICEANNVLHPTYAALLGLHRFSLSYFLVSR